MEKKINILEMLEESGTRYPLNTAFADDKEKYTYQDVIEKAKAIGTHFAKKGDFKRAVAVFMPKTALELVVFMGVVYSGNFYIPIDPDMPFDRIKKILDTVDPIAVVVAGKTAKVDLEDYAEKRVEISDLFNTEADEAVLSAVRKKAIDTDPVYILFTSGSTGMPKGAIISHRSLIDYGIWVRETFDISSETVFGSQTPFYFSMSVLDIYTTICSGASLVIVPKMLFTFAADLVDYLNEKKINTVYWVPSALCMLTKSGILDYQKPEYLKKVLFAGEVMPTKHFNILKSFLPDCLYANLFGPTEITDIGLYYVVDREFADDEPLPIGNTCRNVDVFVIDENGKEVTGTEGQGELYFRGNYLGMGYYDDPKKTAEMFVQNPLNSHYPEVVYKTGDLVRYNEHGELVYVGRKDYQIKHMGNRIELGEIDNAMLQCEGIQTCVCLYYEEDDMLVLYYEAKEECDSKLRSFAQTKVPKYMVPNEYKYMKKLPVNQNGKIDRKKLKEMRGGN